jgi:hypothetical protein
MVEIQMVPTVVLVMKELTGLLVEAVAEMDISVEEVVQHRLAETPVAVAVAVVQVMQLELELLLQLDPALYQVMILTQKEAALVTVEQVEQYQLAAEVMETMVVW